MKFNRTTLQEKHSLRTHVYVITVSEKMKPRMPAMSWSKKITVRHIQNCEEHKEAAVS